MPGAWNYFIPALGISFDMEIYKCEKVQANFDNICAKISMTLYSSGFRMLMESNLQNQLLLELKIITRKCKILGAGELPFDLRKDNPFDGQGNTIYFKMMVFEINENLIQINALEPIYNSEYLLSKRFQLVLNEAKRRIINMIDLIINIQYLTYNDENLKRLYYQ